MKRPRRRTVVFLLVTILGVLSLWGIAANRHHREQRLILAQLKNLRIEWTRNAGWGVRLYDRVFGQRYSSSARLLETRYSLHSSLGGTPIVGLNFSTVRTGDLDAAVPWLERFTTLEFLSLSHSQIGDAHLGKVGHLQQLRLLNLSYSQVSDAGLAELTALAALETLDLSYTNVTHAGLVNLVKLRQLKSLQLIGCKISGPGIASLGRLTNLESLGLTRSDVTNDDLARLGVPAHLRELTLDDTDIDDAGLLHLADLPRLEVVTLSGTKITDRGLVHLGFVRGLLSVNITRTNVTKDAIDELCKALPFADIHSDLGVRRAPKPDTRQ